MIGIKKLLLFQDGNDEYASGRKMYNYTADGGAVTNSENTYGFQYDLTEALEDGIYRPSVTPAIFELRNPNQDIYGKVI